MAYYTPDNSVLGRINNLLAEVDGNEKAAAAKSATELGLSGSAAKDPGGRYGASTHPTRKLDGDSGPAVLGSRGKENEKDVKEEYPAGVDNTSPNSGGTQDDKQLNIGTRQSATGEDPATEDNYKGEKQDPGTSHPANAAELGEKYSSMRFPALVKLAFHKMNDVLADFATGESVTSEKSASAQTTPASPETTKLAAQAGYELADALAGDFAFDKQAAAQAICEQIILDAQRDADNVGAHLCDYFAYRTKMANDMGAGMGGGMPGAQYMVDPSMIEGGVSPETDGAGPEAGGIPGAPGGAPGGEPSPEGGHPEPDGDEMGGLPGGPGGAPGGEGGEGGHEQAINELFNALQEMGISPEELMAAASASHGGEEGAKMASHMPPRVQRMASGMKKAAFDEVNDLYKFAGWVAHLRDNGRTKIKEATGAARKERDAIKGHIREVCGF